MVRKSTSCNKKFTSAPENEWCEWSPATCGTYQQAYHSGSGCDNFPLICPPGYTNPTRKWVDDKVSSDQQDDYVKIFIFIMFILALYTFVLEHMINEDVEDERPEVYYHYLTGF